MLNLTDEELMSLVPLADPQSIESTDLKFYLPKSLPSDWDRDDFIAPPKAIIAFARAVLARYGHQQTRPAAGEVGELVALLYYEAREADLDLMTAEQCHRAAALLEHRYPEPVLLSERLPEPKDCDGEGRCWWWYPPVPEKTYGYWLCEDDATDRAYNEWPSAWLPIYAIQVPTEKP